jgi:UrcA family protein
MVASLACAVLVIGSGVVQAEPRGQARSVTVKYADLNLATPAGVDALYHRIRVAARTVCGSPHERQLDVRRSVRDCNQAAIAEALGTLERKAQLRAQLASSVQDTSD